MLRLSRFFFATKKDFYEILGVKKGATSSELKQAYYSLAKKFHPDANPSKDAKEKFAEINNAYETLSDESKRKVYDSYGMTGDEQEFANQQDPFGAYSSFFKQGKKQQGGFEFDESVFEDFSQFFNMGEQQRMLKGSDIYVNVEISFQDSVTGTQQTISIDRNGVCNTCQGSRCKPGTAPGRCTTCGGKGMTFVRQGPIQFQMTCNKCHGIGTSIKHPCTSCKGQGVGKQNVQESINIPKGINDGQNLRLAGKGSTPDPQVQPGDLVIKISVKPDNYFKRDGYDVITNAYISVAQAVLGDAIKVKTLAGEKSLNVKAGSQDGEKIKLDGQGINKLPPNQNQKGDHIVNLKVVIPTKLSDKQKQLFEELSKLEKQENQPSSSEGVFGKVKNIFK
ncbi:hypothetical protein pb186bvf_021105 [Paramecium bursaria]